MLPDARMFSSIQNEQNTHSYMTVWYTKGIYVSFVNFFVVIPPHHKNVLLLALTLVHYDCYSITGPPNEYTVNILLFPSFSNSHHLHANFPNYKGSGPQIQHVIPLSLFHNEQFVHIQILLDFSLTKRLEMSNTNYHKVDMNPGVHC